MFAEIKWVLHHQIAALRHSITAWCRDASAWRRFWRSYREYKRLAPSHLKPSLDWLYPCIGDDAVETPIEPIYFYQDTWAFERIVQRSPSAHVDVGSHHKFVALLSKVVPVTMVDIRPLSLPLESLQFRHGSILELPFEDGSLSSISCLCVVEHIGLGRYGDPLDPQGTEKAIKELMRVLAPGGNLYISVPIDDENRTYFNAHRSFREAYLFEQFDQLTVIEKRYIFGNGFMHQPVTGFGIGCYHLHRAEIR
jgi:SAM-dependent methyltransferase